MVTLPQFASATFQQAAAAWPRDGDAGPKGGRRRLDADHPSSPQHGGAACCHCASGSARGSELRVGISLRRGGWGPGLSPGGARVLVSVTGLPKCGKPGLQFESGRLPVRSEFLLGIGTGSAMRSVLAGTCACSLSCEAPQAPAGCVCVTPSMPLALR
jgi:hypothetical protein